ncbi:hypothetical protein Tco_1508086, partial [Tanacetum coccineum]
QLRLPVFNKLSTGRSSVSTATTPYVSAASTPTEDDSDAFSSDGIFNGAYDDETVCAVADFNNMDATINVSPIPTLRIHKDYPKDQILGDPKSVVQTRGKIQKDSLAQQALVSYISKQNRTNHKDHQNYLLACFLSQEEPKNISQALQDDRHQDTINAAAGGTFMQKTPKECYELIENMTAHHNHWDTSATQDETSRTISSTTTESPEVVRQLEMMNKNFLDMMR